MEKQKMRPRLRRLLALILALALSLTLTGPAAAETASAETMQLMKTEGGVAVANSRGKSLSIFEKMRLYNGYRIATEEASYAWINLDSAKLVKEDASSEIQLQKDGKKLEILVNSGALLFNVSQPLEEDEALTIRSGTMSAGIRGTCGWVRIVDQWRSQLYVLEGTVTVSVRDPVTGQLKSEPVTGGEVVECVVYPQDREGDKCDILRRRYAEEDVEGFVLTELTEDRALCGKIYDDSGLDILGWLTAGGRDAGEAARERLEADQTELAEKWDGIREEQDGQANHISKDPVWKEDQKPSGNTVPGGTETPPSTGGGTPSVPPPPANSDLTMKVTDDQVMDALGRENSVAVAASGDPAQNTLDIDSGVTVAAGKTLSLADGINVNVHSGQQLQVDGTMNIQGGALINNGTVGVTSGDTLRMTGDLSNSGTLTVAATGRVVVDGHFDSSGTLVLTPGARVQAKGFAADLPLPPDWEVSAAADAEGYYTLVQAGVKFPVTAGGTVTNLRGEPIAGAQVVIQQGGSDLASAATGADGTYTVSAQLDNEVWSLSVSAAGYNGIVEGGQDPLAGTLDKDFQLTAPGWDWRYDSGTKTLHIVGSGAMDDYTNPGNNTNTGPWGAYAPEIERVEIASGITHVGERTFWSCTALTSVSIPDTVTTVGQGAFVDCDALETITFPDSVTSIGNGTFSGCDSLQTVNLPANLAKVNEFTFSGCPRLNNVVIPSGAAAVERYAFENCTGLQAVTIPGTVTEIGQQAFYGCTGLKSVSIPGAAGAIGANAFENCTGLETVTIGAGVADIGAAAFAGCASLQSVVIPATVRTIGGSAFKGSGLTAVTIPEGVTTIGSYAFSTCTALRSVGLPASAGTIGSYAFENSTSLETISIPGGVSAIEVGTFNGCTGLKTAVIPASVTEIRDNAFNRCSGLTDIYFGGRWAQWEAANPSNRASVPDGTTVHCDSFLITFDANGGTLSGEATAATGAGDTLAALPADPARTAENGTTYTFAGWHTAADGGEKVEAGHVFTADTTLYAHWTVGGAGWSYNDSTKVLTITGDEAMIDYGNLADRPWNGYRNEIKTAIIDSGVTGIGRLAFAECDVMTSMVIPTTVTYIHQYAFMRCIALTTINYRGTEAQWDAISKVDGGGFETSPTFNYGYTG